MNSDNENKKVNDLTLQYFSNKNYTNSVNQKLNKNQNNKIENDKKINSKEIKFYRKRIMDFTKKLLRKGASTVLQLVGSASHSQQEKETLKKF